MTADSVAIVTERIDEPQFSQVLRVTVKTDFACILLRFEGIITSASVSTARKWRHNQSLCEVKALSSWSEPSLRRKWPNECGHKQVSSDPPTALGSETVVQCFGQWA